MKLETAPLQLKICKFIKVQMFCSALRGPEAAHLMCLSLSLFRYFTLVLLLLPLTLPPRTQSKAAQRHGAG